MNQLKEGVSIRFESQIIIHILYLGISDSLALAASKVLFISIVVLTVNKPIIPDYPYCSAKKVVKTSLI